MKEVSKKVSFYLLIFFSPLWLLITSPSNNIRRLHSNCLCAIRRIYCSILEFVRRSINIILKLLPARQTQDGRLFSFFIGSSNKNSLKHNIRCMFSVGKHGLLRLLPTSFIFIELTVAERMCKHNDKAFL